jgi:hypothetical protein
MHSQPTHPNCGVEISIRIGQRVRHTDYKGQRVTGVVLSLITDQDGALKADVALDAPIIIPADQHGPAIDIHRQFAPVHEFTPFDDRDELIAELTGTLVGCRAILRTVLSETSELDDVKRRVLKGRIATATAAIAKATGSAA